MPEHGLTDRFPHFVDCHESAGCAFSMYSKITFSYRDMIFWIILILGLFPFAQAQCNGVNRTIFLRADNRVVQSINGITVTGVDLRRCFDLCSNNQDEKGQPSQCASFQHDSQSSCVLSNVNAQPFGPGVLAETQQPNMAIYQKICAPSMRKRTLVLSPGKNCAILALRQCEKPYAFDWIPQSVLLGFAPQVEHYPTVSECLKACLESSAGVPCRSAMFFYESQQCILNSESRKTRPDLFSNDTQGLIADYFDNVCSADGTGILPGPNEGPPLTGPPNPIGIPAPSGYSSNIGQPAGNYVIPPMPGYQPHETYPTLPIYCDHYQTTQFVLTENMGVQEGLDRRIENTDPDICRKLCENNKNERGEVVGCQAYSIDPTSRSCILTSGLSMPRGNLHLIDRSGVNFYEKVCLAHAHPCNGKFPFTRIPAHVLVGFAGEVRRLSSLSECLDSCLNARMEIGYDCRSVMYYYSTTECILNTETRFTRPDLFSADTQGLYVDYFDNTCIATDHAITGSSSYATPATEPYRPPAPQPTYGTVIQPTYGPAPEPSYGPVPQPSYAPVPQPSYGPEPPYGAPQTSESTYESTVPTYSASPWYGPGFTSSSLTTEERQTNASSTENIQFITDCREDGIRVNVIFKTSSSGILFAKNKHLTCKEEFRAAESVVLRIPLWENEKDCGQTPAVPGQYFITVVLQQNGLGISGLMTSDDIMYDVKCEFPKLTHQPYATTTKSTVHVPYFTTPTIPFPYFTTTLAIHPYMTTASRPTPLVVVNAVENQFPDGSTSIPEAQVSMDLLRDNIPVSNVLLGEQLEIRWRISAPPNLGFFVRDCSAERVGGNPPDPSALQLIKDGCPDAAVSGRIINSPISKATDGLATNMTVFRFDGSRSVRLRCLIDMCAGDCTATRCNIKNGEYQSYGKRKRAALERRQDSITVAVAKKTISGVFTIVDQLPNDNGADRRSLFTTAPVSAFNNIATTRNGLASTSSPSKSLDDVESGESRSFLFHNGQICLVRSLFVGLMTTLAIVCTAEGLVVGLCCWSRHCSKTDSTASAPQKLHEKLISAVRRSSFFNTAFGGSSFSQSSTVTATRAFRRKQRSRRREKSGTSTTTTTTNTASSVDEIRQMTTATVEMAKNRRRPILPVSVPMKGPPVPVRRLEKPKLTTPIPPKDVEKSKSPVPEMRQPMKPGEWKMTNGQTNAKTLRPAAGSLSGASTIDCPMTIVKTSTSSALINDQKLDRKRSDALGTGDLF